MHDFVLAGRMPTLRFGRKNPSRVFAIPAKDKPKKDVPALISAFSSRVSPNFRGASRQVIRETGKVARRIV
jgi:hypothetical protein